MNPRQAPAQASGGAAPAAINARAAIRAEIGGVERFARELALRLPALRPDRYRVIRPPAGLAHRAGHIWEQLVLPLKTLRYAFLLSPANLAPVIGRANVVVIHDAAALKHPEAYTPAYVSYQRRILPLIAARARLVLTVSEFSRSELIELLGVSPERVRVVPEGVDERFSPHAQPAAAAHRYGLTRPYVLCVGTVSDRKNLVALEPAARVLDGQGIELVLAGSDRGYMRGPATTIRRLGYVPEPELPGLYAGAVALVMPSRYEGFGLPCLEAMASGIPVVAANAGALPETCGDAALLVPPGEPDKFAAALRAVSGQQGLRARLIAEGLARAARFTWGATAEQTDAAIGELPRPAERSRTPPIPARLHSPAMRRLALLLCILTLTPAALASAPAASARVPQGFVGMMADGVLFDHHISLTHQLDLMVASGVESLRTVFDWSHAEPYATCAEVPRADTGKFDCIGGVPINFQPTDTLVALAAKRGLTLLPVVFDAPGWAAKTITPGDFPLPASDDLYANFMAALVNRYGPHGSFWAANPRLRPVPIRMWQIWNEPSLELYWPIQPFADTYVALVHAAHDAIKRIDPGAKVVLAGMPNFVWYYVSQIYDVPGSKQYFDVVAVHPFTAQPAGVITILQRVRDVMDRAGDTSKPILATEVSFPSAQGKSSQHFGFETTEAGQAAKLSQLLPMLAAKRNKLHLLGFYHYTWLSRDIPGNNSFDFGGLFRFRRHTFTIVTKPAYPVFRQAALAMEGCRVKAKVATRCARH